MMDRRRLEEMSHIGLKDISPDHLTDILEVELYGENAGQRLEDCMAKLGNPYCFKVGETPVRVSFQADGETLEKKLRSYFMGLKL